MLVYAGHPGSSLPQCDIKRMRKQFRCHRDMSRLAMVFIEKVWRESIGIKIKDETVKEENEVKKMEEEDDEEDDNKLYYMMEI